MKVVMFSDIHYGNHSNSDEFNQQCNDFLSFVKDWTDEHLQEPFITIFMGDWFHNRNTINVKTLNYAKEGLITLSNIGSEQYLILGNHDLYYRNQRDVSSVIIPEEAQGIEVIAEPLVIKDKLLLTPWLLEDETIKDLIEKHNPEYVFGHFEIPSFKFNQKVVCQGEYNPFDYQGPKHIYSGHFHCLTPDHEVLTNNGWKYIKDISKNDIVVTYNTETDKLEYNNVDETHIYDVNEKLYHYTCRGYDTIVTSDHRVFCKKDNKPLFFNPKDGDPYNAEYILAGCMDKKGIDLSDDMIRLLVWIAADGSLEIHSNGSFNGCRFHLSKQRKIDELTSLLNRIGITYSCNKQKDGKKYKIRIMNGDYYKFGLDTYFPNYNKILPSILKDVNKHQADVILQTYAITDGHIYNNRNTIQISTSKEVEKDLLQEIMVVNGYKCTYTERIFENPSHKKAYIINVNPKSYVNPLHLNCEMVDYNGKVYCLTVKNHTFMVRHNGKVYITGNCFSEKNNITYIGNCFSNDFSDTNDWHNKGFVILDTDSCETVRVEWKDAPKYLVTKLSEVEKTEFPNNLHLRLINDTELDNDDINKLQQDLLDSGKVIECQVLPKELDLSGEVESIEMNDIGNMNVIIPDMLTKVDMEGIRADKLVEIYNNLGV